MTTNAERDKELIKIAEAQWGLVTWVQLRALGITSRGIDARIDRGLLRRVTRGVYSLAWVDAGWQQDAAAAALAIGPPVVLSHMTAARLWELDLPPRNSVELTVPRRRNSLRPPDGVRVHRSRSLLKGDVAWCAGMPVTTPERTFVDVAGRFGNDRLVRALGAAIGDNIVDPLKLAELLVRPGIRVRQRTGVLREALEPWLEGVESVSEAELLRIFELAGLPPPVTNYEIKDGSEVIARVDFAWPDLKLAVEIDGFRFHRTPEQHSHDSRRANRIGADGWTVQRTTPNEVRTTPVYFLDSVRNRVGRRPPRR